MGAYEKLFSPIQIRGLTLKNRVVLSGMGTKMMQDRYVTQELIDYHVARAKGGAALNIVEVSSVHMPSAPFTYGCLADDKFIPGYKKLTDAVHKVGGKVGVFLWQGGLVIGGEPNAQVFVPSDMPVSEELTYKGVTKEQIEELVEAFGQAARRAVEAGMDVLELHGAHTYIIHSFLSGAINHRTDEYGGSIENRARFPLEVIQSIRKNMPEDMPLFMRVNAHDDYLEGGLTIDETIQFCKWASDAGVDVVDVSRGNVLGNGLKYEVPPMDLAPAFNVDNAAQIREETGMKVMAVGRINSPVIAERIVENGQADLVCIGRAQLTDPEFCNKAKEGRTSEIRRCIGCNQGCFDAHMKPELTHISCVRNPSVAQERTMEIRPAVVAKKVLVMGGGMAGLEAAEVLAKRGHQVVLCEQSDKLGGSFLDAGLGPKKAEMRAAANHQGTRIEQMDAVEVRLKTKVDPSIIDEIAPDFVINAIGAGHVPEDIPGVAHAISALDVLQGTKQPSGHVAVVGGGVVGLDVAEVLADQGATVTLIEKKDDIGWELGTTRKIAVMERVMAADITAMPGTTCTQIDKNQVHIKTGDDARVLDVDAVVIAAGVQSNPADELKQHCFGQIIPYYTVGDATRPRTVQEAIAEAAQLARKV